MTFNQNKKVTKRPLVVCAIIAIVLVAVLAAVTFFGIVPWNAHVGDVWWGVRANARNMFVGFLVDTGIGGTGRAFWDAAAAEAAGSMIKNGTMFFGAQIGDLAILACLIATVFFIINFNKHHVREANAYAIAFFIAGAFTAYFASFILDGYLNKVIWLASSFWISIEFLGFLAMTGYLGYICVATCLRYRSNEPADELVKVILRLNDKVNALAAQVANGVVAAPAEEVEEDVPAVVAAMTEQEEVVEEVVEEPVEETVVEEEVEEAPVAEEAVAVVEEDGDIFSGMSAKKRASFETRLRKSEEVLRHQYYDLRDYIKSYGVKNRISFPGDTFSLKRERFVFITISGKSLKVYFALDPKKYADSPIPTEAVSAKKFEDLPTCLKVRSGLSLRRAMKLVDDVMAEKGLSKPAKK